MNTYRFGAFVHPLDNTYRLQTGGFLTAWSALLQMDLPLWQIPAPKQSHTMWFTSCSRTSCCQLLGGWKLLLSGKCTGSSTRKCCDKKRQPVLFSVFCFDTLQLSITHDNERLNTLDNDKLRQFFFFCPLSVSAPWFPGCLFPGCQVSS